MNKYQGESELEHVCDFLRRHIDFRESKCIALNQDVILIFYMDFNLNPLPLLILTKKYVNSVFSKLKYDYENLPIPTKDELLELLLKCHENFEKTRKKINWKSDTTIILKIDDETFAAISCNGSGYKIISESQANSMNHILMMKTDPRLLKWLLQGPGKAHWSMADIGCHITYKRIPNTYERGL